MDLLLRLQLLLPQLPMVQLTAGSTLSSSGTGAVVPAIIQAAPSAMDGDGLLTANPAQALALTCRLLAGRLACDIARPVVAQDPNQLPHLLTAEAAQAAFYAAQAACKLHCAAAGATGGDGSASQPLFPAATCERCFQSAALCAPLATAAALHLHAHLLQRLRNSSSTSTSAGDGDEHAAQLSRWAALASTCCA